MKRRNFIKNASLTGVGLTVGSALTNCAESSSEEKSSFSKASDVTKASLPLVIPTWNVKNATAKSWEVINKGGSAIECSRTRLYD